MIKKNLPALAIAVAILCFFSWNLVRRHSERFAKDGQTNSQGFLNTLEWLWYDLKFRNRPAEPAHGVIVGRIDDASLEKFGRWPWNRSVYKEILDYLYEMGAEVVAFDAVFSEPEFNERYLRDALSSADIPGRVQSVQAQLGLSNEQLDGLSSNLTIIGDQIFSSAVMSHPQTVLGYFWLPVQSCPIYDPLNPEHQKQYDQVLDKKGATSHLRLHADSMVESLGVIQKHGILVESQKPFSIRGDETESEVLHCPVTNRGNISANAHFEGYFNAVPDRDGLFRRTPLVVGMSSEFIPNAPDYREWLPPKWFEQAVFFPSLAVQAVVSLWNKVENGKELAKLSVEMTTNTNGHSEVSALVIPRDSAASVRVPTLPDGSIAVNFYGTQDTSDKPIPEFSLAGIYGELSDAAFQEKYKLDPLKPLKGQVVFIGPTAMGVYDLRPNPVQGNAPGVFIHATVAARILQHATQNASSVAVRFSDLRLSQILLWSLGLLATLSLLSARASLGLVFTVFLLGCFLGMDYYVFATHSFALDAMSGALCVFSIAVTILGYKYFTEERDRAFVKGAFEKYVSPDVVSSILADPKKLNLGGQKKELSVMFSDIRGFTTISERMGAAELAKFMNDYLSPMTDIILENRGTIDKYMGDAIMAIFGAPVEYENHAQKAVDAALAMLAKLKELQVVWEEQGLPHVDIGVGINTGDMSVGNMGSKRIFSYTVMGDSVNLGSRLEGINKEYGTRLIVSQSTVDKLGPGYRARELDRVRVKGKLQPVTIFEVVGRDVSSERGKQLDQFSEALQLYYKQKFQLAGEFFAKLAPTDGTSEIYAKRCAAWLEDPPAEDWDGSWTMKSK